MLYLNLGLFLDMFWWGLVVFCKPFGFKHIGEVSVDLSVNVDGNDSREVDMDIFSCTEKHCVSETPIY